MKKYTLTGIGPDKPGIVAGMTAALADCGGNIEDSAMTILANQFALILIGAFPDKATLEGLREAFAPVAAALDMTLDIRELHETAAGAPAHAPGENTYILSVAGRDRTGITAAITRILAAHQVNITDLNARLMENEDGPVYIMMVEAVLPAGLDVDAFERELAAMGESLHVEISYHPVEVVAL
ncbi:MAG: ACT domain-containing protein [Vampirovibrionales bacterium]|nr:ACT domain-containing protein [Vampirovibrionales bacterium]